MKALRYLRAACVVALECVGFWASGAWLDGEARRDLRVAVRDAWSER